MSELYQNIEVNITSMTTGSMIWSWWQVLNWQALCQFFRVNTDIANVKKAWRLTGVTLGFSAFSQNIIWLAEVSFVGWPHRGWQWCCFFSLYLTVDWWSLYTAYLTVDWWGLYTIGPAVDWWSPNSSEIILYFVGQLDKPWQLFVFFLKAFRNALWQSYGIHLTNKSGEEQT